MISARVYGGEGQRNLDSGDISQAVHDDDCLLWVDVAVRLQDVYDHVLRAIDLIDGQRERMGNAVDWALGLMASITVIGSWCFRRKDWL